MIQSPAGYQGDVRIKRYLDFYQAGYGVAMLSSGVAFSPLSLFANGEPGGFYDFSDLSVMFQDAAGTTPVTAVEQPVGLVLDKSKGAPTLGSELISNGTFSSDLTGWSTGGTVTWNSGAARIDATVAGNFLRQGFATTVGTMYRLVLSATIVSGSTNAQVYVGSTSGGLDVYFNSSVQGTLSVVFTAVSTTSFLTMRIGGGGASAGSIMDFDNVSVKAIPGSHLSQSTAAARPVLSARVNLLTHTEDFSQGIWVKSFCTASAMNVADPVGGNTASTITATAASGFFYHNASSATTTVSNSIWVRRRTGTGAIRFRTAAGGTDTDYSSSITSSWSLLTWQCTPSGGLNTFVINLATSGDAIDIWHPDCRPANAGVGLPSYQRVGAATSGSSTAAGNADYDSGPEWPRYLRFDGTDDSLSSAAIDFTSTDKMAVFAGMRKLSDATSGAFVELSAVAFSNPGSFWLFAPGNVSGSPVAFDWLTRGNITYASSQPIAPSVATYPAPGTFVLTGTGDIAGDGKTLRVNGSQAATNSSDQGAGNFGNYPLFVGSRNNASFRFSGNLYSLIVRGAATDAATITATETWVNGKTKAF